MTVGALITARLKSTRLPKKAIAPIQGRPMIEHLIRRLESAASPEKIVVCTSPREEDDPLVEIAQRCAVEHYRGDPVDVLSRIRAAAETHNVDTIFSCTADNPLTGSRYLDTHVRYHLAGGFDFTDTAGLPIGTFGYVVNRDALDKACTLAAKKNTEVWGGYFTQTGAFEASTFAPEDEILGKLQGVRLTVDWPEDLALVREIFARLYEGDPVFSLQAVAELFEDEPELFDLNLECHQKPPEPIEVRTDAQPGGSGS